MGEHSLIAEFPTAALARRMSKEVAVFLTTSAKELDKAAPAPGLWPDEPTPAALAFGKKYGVTWDEPLTWGSDRLADSEPAVGVLDRALVMFHDDIAGGFGAELPRLLAKAGAKVRMAARPPIVHGTIPIRPATRALVRKLTTWFEQRLENKDLPQWTPPPWSRRRASFGRAADVQFVVDDTTCTFTMPVQPADLETMRAFLAKAGTLRIATPTDEKALAKREHTTVLPEPAVATKPAAISRKIPTKTPTVTRFDGPRMYAACSTGDTLYTVLGDRVFAGRDLASLEEVGTLDKMAKGIFVDGDEVWIAGSGLWRMKGKSITKQELPSGVDPEFWGKEFRGIAKDPSGVVWVGGTWVVTVRGDKVVQETKPFSESSRVKAVVATPFGALLLTFTGAAFLAHNGQVQRLPVRGKGHLSDACITPRGTLVIVGSGAKWSAEIYRSEDGGASFKPVRLAKLAPLQAVAAFSDGRLVAGGSNLLLVSVDDGKTWKPVKPPAADVTFDILCRHGDRIIGDSVAIH